MQQERRIKVLVVEDSMTARTLLVRILNDDPRLQVIGTATNGVEAISFVGERTPDVIVMDVHMPEMDGFEATRHIMETRPVPIVICSATANLNDAVTSFRLMEAGAVACVEKPCASQDADFVSQSAHLCRTVTLMSEVKVVRRWARREHQPAKIPTVPKINISKPQIVGIGASTGGPPVLQTILAGLPKDFPLAVVIVQHIAPGFLGGLVEWLNQTTGMKIHVAGYGTQAIPGHAYLAPDDFHLVVRENGMLVLNKAAPDNGLRPAVNYLFHSLAETYAEHVIGVLLTGMGKDGAQGLKKIREGGATTIVQDRETSVVHGMPGEAIALGAASHVLPADRIATAITGLVYQSQLP